MKEPGRSMSIARKQRGEGLLLSLLTQFGFPVLGEPHRCPEAVSMGILDPVKAMVKVDHDNGRLTKQPSRLTITMGD